MIHSFKSMGFVLAGVVSALLIGSGSAQAAAAIVGNATTGATTFSDLCSICHVAERGAPSPVGPNLFGVVGRKSGTAPGFIFSAAMKNANLTWNDASLRTFLQAPQKGVPGTSMGFVGVTDPQDEADLLAFLNALK